MLKNKGKVILIDFWSRWCGPCVHEIPFSQVLERQLGGKKIVFIYVSFDLSKSTWTEGMNDLNFVNKQNSYLHITPYLSSEIYKYYKVMHIPKYVIYNKKGELVNTDAPRPSDPALKKILNKLIEES